MFRFEGCYNDRSVGERASGEFYLNSLIMMPAKMDSGRFGVKICKDEDCQQVIAVMDVEQEPYISKDRMVVNDMSSDTVSISALIDRV